MRTQPTVLTRRRGLPAAEQALQMTLHATLVVGARHDLLARVAALAETHPRVGVVAEHLGEEEFYKTRVPGDSTRNLCGPIAAQALVSFDVSNVVAVACQGQSVQLVWMAIGRMILNTRKLLLMLAEVC